jgi:hypothetical protein
MLVELNIYDDFCDRLVVASLSAALARARKQDGDDYIKYSAALIEVLDWYTVPSESHKHGH